MHLRLLGPVMLSEDDGTPVVVTAPKRRALLSALALELNSEVPAARLIESVWGPSAPPTARAALQGHVAALRKLLGPDLTLATGHMGYRLEGEPEHVDLHLSRALYRQAGQSGAEEARALLSRASALWESSPLDDCGSEQLVQAWRGRLQDEGRRVEEALERLNTSAVPSKPAAISAAPVAERNGDPSAAAATSDPTPPTHCPEAPRAIRGFSGRARELAWLDTALGEPENGVVTVVGPAGVGKTSLVLHWTRLRRAWFPDGQLYVNLRGFDETEPLTLGAVTATFLMALGVPAEQLPSTDEARIGRLGELLRRRRTLVILDNARSAAQILPLQPVLTSHAVVVTSRHRLDDLVVGHDARPLALAVPEPAEAGELMAQALGARWAHDDPASLQRIVDLCDRLPLALRIVAARLSARPSWSLSQAAQELADEQARLELLSTSGSLGVESALQATCRTLPPATARLLALTGLHPGREIDAFIAAALAGTSVPDAREMLSQLSRAHLMEEVRPGSFARHDLIRLHSQQALERLSSVDRSTALRRMVDQYMATTAKASTAVRNWPTRQCTPPAGATPEYESPAAALRWFVAEESTIRAIATSPANEVGEAWRLSAQTGTLYHHAGGLLSEWTTITRSGLTAAELAGDVLTQAILQSELGVSYLEQGNFKDAAAPLARALTLADAAGGLRERVRARTRFANLLARTGDSARAITLQREASELVVELGDDELTVLVLNNLADTLLLAGRPAEALEHMERLMLIPAGHEHPTYFHTHAEILHALGREEDALPMCRRALTLAEGQNPRAMAHAHSLMGTVLLALGRREEAAQHWRSALAQFRDQKRDTGDLADRLARLESRTRAHS